MATLILCAFWGFRYLSNRMSRMMRFVPLRILWPPLCPEDIVFRIGSRSRGGCEEGSFMAEEARMLRSISLFIAAVTVQSNYRYANTKAASSMVYPC